MKKWVMAVMLGVSGFAVQAYAAPTTQVDALIEKLIDKGILTKDEAEGLKGQIANDAGTLNEAAAKKAVPDWLQNFKIGGDMRVRLQDERRRGSLKEDRVRGRYRARLNFETKPNDKSRVVIGIATDDANNPRSNNVTFSGSTTQQVSGTVNTAGSVFSKPNIVLNKAYGEYTPIEGLTLVGGKVDNPIWEPMEFLWDSDITPEGGFASYKYKLNNMFSLATTGGVFMLREFSSSASDPFVWFAQAILTGKLTDTMDAKASFMYQGYANIKSGFDHTQSGVRPQTSAITATSPANTIGPAGGDSLQYDYSAPVEALDIGINDPFAEFENVMPFYIGRIGMFGEYTNNPSPTKNNVAWMAGGYIGNSKVSGWGTWKLIGAYKVLEKDAWLDILPDQDFYSGGTDVKGIEAAIEIGLAKNLSFGFDYYNTRRISSAAAKSPEHLLQADILWKF